MGYKLFFKVSNGVDTHVLKPDDCIEWIKSRLSLPNSDIADIENLKFTISPMYITDIDIAKQIMMSRGFLSVSKLTT